MIVFKKRQVVLTALVVMILVAGYLNINHKDEIDGIYNESQNISAISTEDAAVSKNLGEATFVNKDSQEEPGESKENEQVIVNVDSSKEYFIQARMEKEQSRGEALEVLSSIIHNDNSTPDIRNNAQKETITIAKSIEKETIVENLIRAKGFGDAVVFIDEGIINVVVKTEGLATSQAAQITDIAMSQTGAPIDKIKILEIK